MASQSTVISTVRGNADLLVAEYDNDALVGWVNAALYQHNALYTFDTLPTAEVDCVVFLAWIKACYSRASKATQYYSIGGKEGSINKAEIVNNNLSLIPQLREEYVTLCHRLGVDPSPAIIVSDVTKFDVGSHGMTPVGAHMPPKTSVLTATGYTGTTVDLAWTEAQPKDTFLRYRIFYGTSAGLQDMTTLGDLNALYYGVSATKATLLKTYDEKWRISARVTGLDAETTYYFVVVLEDVNGRFSVSNEESIGTTTPIDQLSSLRYATFLIPDGLVPLRDYVKNVSFTDKITVESVQVQVTTAPDGEDLVFGVFTEADGGGDGVSIVIPEGSTSNAINGQRLIIPTTEAMFIRTGSTTGAAQDTTVIVAYRLAEKYSNVYNEEGEAEYRLTVAGTPPGEHVVIERRSN